MINAATRRRPGLSLKDHPLERVTKMRAWLMVLTWRYTADASCWFIALDTLGSDILKCFLLKFFTPKCLCPKKTESISYWFLIRNTKNSFYCDHAPQLVDEKKVAMQEAYRKKVSFIGHLEEYYSHDGKVTAYDNSSSENFTQLPAIWNR